ncbi:hypothetical protein HD554DRAFT_2041975 [Boletus coccyginus]|nr:hypothetical protein HD554DRAFT_2041972 [Boletus coccyginus]KAI9459057.1 hypothetical protein HD554DRAFT_2041975 [Boletus coccyginus]
MVQNTTLHIGIGSSESAAPTLQESYLDIAELAAHFANVHISNNILVLLINDSVLVQSDLSTDPDQAASTDLDVTPPLSPRSGGSLPTSSKSDFKDIFPPNAIPPLNLPSPGMAILTGPPHPSVLDWYRLYRGYYYYVPPPTTALPFYMVTKGLCVGIFSGWEIMGTLTIKISGSI